MNEPLSIFELITGASIAVLLVMLLLVLASVASWIMIFNRWRVLRVAIHELDTFEDYFWSGIDLREFYGELADDEQLSGIENMFVSGFREFDRLSEQANAEPDSVMQGVQRAMRVALTREEERLETHLAFLATVGSTSPYVGLFGTVIGIMNSFRSLANMSQATLASVAPGISEALIATAIGLFAAIPAVIAYNRYSAKVDVLVKRYEAFNDELVSILFRAAHTQSSK
ncbi:MAG: protein TolQ [Gammaproteobacteria bacterium]|nr:protein TolQ [Gammaproteobacteria bacterium]HAO55147.1 protein TolQ [Gammaproteobacteria bacterium]